MNGIAGGKMSGRSVDESTLDNLARGALGGNLAALHQYLNPARVLTMVDALKLGRQAREKLIQYEKAVVEREKLLGVVDTYNKVHKRLRDVLGITKEANALDAVEALVEERNRMKKALECIVRDADALNTEEIVGTAHEALTPKAVGPDVN